MKSRLISNNSGFSLIEMMIVIAVLAIIVAVAVPSYNDYIIRSKRSEAKAMLSLVTSQQEQFFLNNKSYTTSNTAINVNASSENDLYDLSMICTTTAGGRCLAYEVKAQPTVAGGQRRDVDCYTFTLTSDGTRGNEDSSPADVTDVAVIQECWGG